ncbi:MAG: hypothetical protein IK109_08730 [Clostridiales bacterium]|nr:hypothetical protein [Clostridiales bacterium]
MKKASKTVLTAVLAAALLVSATGCDKNTNARSDKKKSTKITSEVNGTGLVARRPPDLEGKPDKENKSEKGVMHSSEAKEPVISELRSAYSVINWEAYSEIVSGSEFTVEAYISEAYEESAPDEITMYVFQYNNDYEWCKDEAYAEIKGSPVRPIVGQNGDQYETSHTYWIKGMLPKDMPSGRYTMVFVLPDGSVDSMVDFNLVQPNEAPEPIGID